MPKPALEMAHELSAAKVAELLGVQHETGLGSSEISLRQKKYGPNHLRHRKPRNALVILAHQFKSVIFWLLAGATLFSFAIGDRAEAFAIIIVLLINGAIGFFIELRAARSMESLWKISKTITRVRRDGRVCTIDARHLVPGDIVILEAGDVITADLRLTEAAGLQCNESILTGEATPVDKDIAPLPRDTPLGDRSCMAFKGTSITRGTGEAIVVATGMDSEIGRISKLVQEAGSEATRLEVQLDRLGHRLVWLMFVLAALTILAGILRGYPIAEIVQTGVALAVATVPEGLPVVATISLARGMWHMAGRNALINRLSSVETLGSTTLIMTDKTGTLTENRMTVLRYLVDQEDITVAKDGPIDTAGKETLAWAIRIGELCNSAELDRGTPNDGTGDPMELALLSVAARTASSGAAGEKVTEHAFDPDFRMMASVYTDAEGFLYAVKGAPEALIQVCGQVLGPNGLRDLDDAMRDLWLERSSDAAAEGLRCLALAMKKSDRSDAHPYEDLALVGLVALADPVRAGVPVALRACKSAGIWVIMITGDHASTAARIARDAGISDDQPSVVEGNDLVGFDPENVDPQMEERLRTASVFARVAPETKLALVKFFQQSGEVVAVTGDGVNDAPALRKSDIGIAMGLRGTQVAREAAEMVLKDDSFATIVAAVREGRIIFDNVRKFVVYLMSCNVSEILVVGLAVGAGLAAPLMPLHILFLNLVTDVFPAFALGVGPGDKDVLKRPPRNPAEPIVDRQHWVQVGVLGVIITTATLAAFILALEWLKLDHDRAVTVAFVTLSLSQLWNVFNARTPGGRLLASDIARNPFVWGALILCLLLVAAALWIPSLSSVLALPSPGHTGLALAALLSLLPLLFGQLYLAWVHARSKAKMTDNRVHI